MGRRRGGIGGAGGEEGGGGEGGRRGGRGKQNGMRRKLGSGTQEGKEIVEWGG